MSALLLLLLQAEAFRAELRWERSGKRAEAWSVLEGVMVVRAGDALAADVRAPGSRSRPTRIRLRGERAVVVKGRSKIARVTRLSDPGRFHPLDLWRRPGLLRRRFRRAEGGAPRALPDAVSDGEGKRRRAARVRRRSPGWAAAPEAGAPLEVRLFLPKDPALARRIRSIRIQIDAGTGRIVRAVVDRPGSLEVLEVAGWEEIQRPDDSAFSLDLSGLKTEER